MKLVNLSLLIAAPSLMLACSTSMTKDFDLIRTGAPKYDVVESMGSPSHSERVEGKDRWTYVYNEASQEYVKQVVFEEGKVVYKGDPQKPLISAEEQDKKNEVENQELEKLYAQRRLEIKTKNIEDSTDTAVQDTRAFVPHFKPID